MRLIVSLFYQKMELFFIILIGSVLAKSLLNKSEQNLSLKIFAIVVINNYFLLKRIIIYE